MTRPPSRTLLAGNSGDFARWAITTLNPLTETEVEAFLRGRLGMEIRSPRTTRPGPRFQVGDSVIIRGDKHADPKTAAPYNLYNGKVGRVVEATPTAVGVRFNTGEEVAFEGAQKARGVGMYRYTAPFTMVGSPGVEMVYLAAAEDISPDQKVTVEKYLGGGRGEKRSGNYYSGHIFNALYNQAGQVYFTVFSHQRIDVDPQSEGGAQPRSFNPLKGKMVYIGLLGKRPRGWENEWEAAQLAAAGMEGSEVDSMNMAARVASRYVSRRAAPVGTEDRLVFKVRVPLSSGYDRSLVWRWLELLQGRFQRGGLLGWKPTDVNFERSSAEVWVSGPLGDLSFRECEQRVRLALTSAVVAGPEGIFRGGPDGDVSMMFYGERHWELELELGR